MDTTPDTFPLRELLEHGDLVRRLARSLVADEHAALDLEQDVWMAALERRPRGLASAPAWLARVARNLAANRARGAERRREREERVAAEQDARGAPAEDAERDFELQRRVADAVHRLAEPYRTAILLRYVRELSHAEIASATGAPVATVRTRLSRGLARLRAELDRAHGGDRDAWRHGLVLLVGRDLRPALPVGAGGLLAGGAIVGTMAKVTAAAAAVALAGWWLWPAVGGEAPTDGVAGAAAGGAEELVAAAPLPEEPPTAGRVALASADAPEDARHAAGELAPAVPAEPERGWFVAGRVHGLAAGDAADAEVIVTGVNATVWPAELVARAPVAADGAFRADVTQLVSYGASRQAPLHALNVEVVHPRHVRGEVRLSAAPEHRVTAELDELEGPITWRADVRLRAAAVLTGRALLPDGAPAAGARVLAWRLVDGAPEETAADDATCAADGRFRLRLPHGGEHVVGALADALRPATARAAGTVGAERTLDAPLVLEEGAVLAGRVLRLGAPVAEAGVWVRWSPDGRYPPAVQVPGRPSLVWVEGRIERATSRPTTDGRGAWTATGLRPGRHRVHASSVPAFDMGLGGQTQGEVEVVAPARGIDLAFAYSGLRFESESGLAPDARGTLRVMHSDGRDTAANLRGDLLAVCGIPGERVTFEIRFEGYEAWRAELVFPPAGEDRTVPVALAPAPAAASLELAVSAPEEAPVAAVALGLFDAGNALDANAEPLATRVAVVVDGVARFDGLDPSRTRAVVQAGDRFLSRSSHDRSYLRWIELDLDLAPGERAHRAVAFELGGRLAIVARDERGAALPAEIEVRDADGRELDVAFVAVHDSMRQGNTWRLSPLAPNETFPSLAPGEVELRLALAGFAPRTVRATVAPGRTTPVDVVLRAE